MINWKVVMLIVFLWTLVCFFIFSFSVAVNETQKRLKRLEEVDGIVEEICGEAQKNSNIQAGSDEGDYDVYINNLGTRKIREILKNTVSW